MKLFTQGVQKADIRRISGRTDLPGQRFSIDQDNSHFEKHDMFKFLIAIDQSSKDPQDPEAKPPVRSPDIRRPDG